MLHRKNPVSEISASFGASKTKMEVRIIIKLDSCNEHSYNFYYSTQDRKSNDSLGNIQRTGASPDHRIGARLQKRFDHKMDSP